MEWTNSALDEAKPLTLLAGIQRAIPRGLHELMAAKTRIGWNGLVLKIIARARQTVAGGPVDDHLGA